MDKKVYVKPNIYMERFELAQHIANCTFELATQIDYCHFIGEEDSLFEGIAIINDSIQGCAIQVSEYCEFAASSEYNTFNS